MEGNFYWTVIVGLFSAGWILTAYIRDIRSQSIARISTLMNVLLDHNKLSIENPDIRKYFSQTASKNVDYFRTSRVLKDETFFKAKSFATQG